MTIFNLIILGIVVGANNLAVALALGALNGKRRKRRIVLTFGLFEFCVPLIGLLLGSLASKLIADYATYLGAGILILLGLLTAINGLRNNKQDKDLAKSITSLKGIVFLAAGLSLDNLIVGFSLGLDNASPFLVAGTIAFFSMLFTYIGLKLGSAGKHHWQKHTKIGAGVLLILLGIAIALSYL